jgi:hypothetical protein
MRLYLKKWQVRGNSTEACELRFVSEPRQRRRLRPSDRAPSLVAVSLGYTAASTAPLSAPINRCPGAPPLR